MSRPRLDKESQDRKTMLEYWAESLESEYPVITTLAKQSGETYPKQKEALDTRARNIKKELVCIRKLLSLIDEQNRS